MTYDLSFIQFHFFNPLLNFLIKAPNGPVMQKSVNIYCISIFHLHNLSGFENRNSHTFTLTKYSPATCLAHSKALQNVLLNLFLYFISSQHVSIPVSKSKFISCFLFHTLFTSLILLLYNLQIFIVLLLGYINPTFSFLLYIHHSFQTLSRATRVL